MLSQLAKAAGGHYCLLVLAQILTFFFIKFCNWSLLILSSMASLTVSLELLRMLMSGSMTWSRLSCPLSRLLVADVARTQLQSPVCPRPDSSSCTALSTSPGSAPYPLRRCWSCSWAGRSCPSQDWHWCQGWCGYPDPYYLYIVSISAASIPSLLHYATPASVAVSPAPGASPTRSRSSGSATRWCWTWTWVWFLSVCYCWTVVCLSFSTISEIINW